MLPKQKWLWPLSLAESAELHDPQDDQRTGKTAAADGEVAHELAASQGIAQALSAGEKRIRSILEAAHEAFVGIDARSIITD
jgi:hypothetical protein